MQTARFADLYSHSFITLINYPLFYQFHAVAQALPHESTAWAASDEDSNGVRCPLQAP